jgi:flagellar L-ring protein precursor FlgH
MRRLLIIALCGAATGVWGDSLFSKQASARGTLISENNARFAIGDVVTVLVRENIDARTRAELDTEKKSELSGESAEADNASLTGGDGYIDLKPGFLPNWDIDVENKHESDGSTRRRNEVTFTVACTVTQVHPNGNLELQGEKKVTVNRDDSFIKLTGTARTRDVSAQNTVDSNLLANAQIELKGQGPLWNSQRRGWFNRLFDWFSPF